MSNKLLHYKNNGQPSAAPALFKLFAQLGVANKLFRQDVHDPQANPLETSSSPFSWYWSEAGSWMVKDATGQIKMNVR